MKDKSKVQKMCGYMFDKLQFIKHNNRQSTGDAYRSLYEKCKNLLIKTNFLLVVKRKSTNFAARMV